MSFNFRLSQLDALPKIEGAQLGNTIGQGSFALVKVANVSKHVFAIKFIHRKISQQHGMSEKQIGNEYLLHKQCCQHPNIIRLYKAGADENWMFIVMELAPGGDLFDKIEPDMGVDEEVAHFYFKQMINAIDFCHKKGVAHRDIKPENILLDSRGNLKLADFGLAAVFKKSDGSRRLCYTPCGSPPYMAPELASKDGYDPEASDIWSCGCVLFVLLTGQTPWEEPTSHDPFFKNFYENDGNVLTYPWNKFSPAILSLLRLILKPSISKRGTMERIRNHTWVNKEGLLSGEDGMCKDPTLLTSRLLERLHITLSDEQFVESSIANNYDSMTDHFIASQPVVDLANMIDDIDDNDNGKFNERLPATQQEFTEHKRNLMQLNDDIDRENIFKFISKDPAVLQFSKDRSRFKSTKTEEIFKSNSAERLTRFFSIFPLESLYPIIQASLNRVGVSTPEVNGMELTEQFLRTRPVQIPIIAVDRRKMFLRGHIKISKVEGVNKLKTVEFIKTKGDPLEWRRFFKRVTILSREAVYIEDGGN